VPDDPAPIAFIVIDERGLAAGLVVPLVLAVGSLLHFTTCGDQGAPMAGSLSEVQMIGFGLGDDAPFDPRLFGIGG
jgi:hypothetical protein